MRITFEHVGIEVALQVGSYMTKTAPAVRKARLQVVRVQAISPADGCGDDICVRTLEGELKWVDAALLSPLDEHPELMSTPKPADVGRVYVHGHVVRVLLINDRGVSLNQNDHQVVVKCLEPTEDGLYLVVDVDFRNLAPTDERIEVPA